MKHKIIKILTIFVVAFSVCCVNLCIFIPVPAYAQATSIDELANLRKNEILKNYPPNLSEMQEIGFGTKTVSKNGELVEQRVRPDIHFRGEDGKEYLVFYNNHIEQLQNIIYKKFESNINEHRLTFIGDKNPLTEFANSNAAIQFSESDIYQKFLMSFIKYILFGSSYMNKFEKAATLAVSSNQLLRAHKNYGGNLDNTDQPCLAIVDRDLTSVANINVKSEFAPIEKEFYKVMTSPISYKDKIMQLNSLLERYLVLTTPEASIMHTIAFCFPLNRASHYLSNLEKDIQNKDLETLEAMYALRKKINRLTLEHRFMFEQNKAPILGITIDRCKIIVEDEHRTMIFLDQQETKKFISTVEKMLDSKASVLSGKYSFDGFTGAQLRELAEKLKPESYDDMIETMNADIRKAEAESASQLADVTLSASRAVGKFILNDGKISFTNKLTSSEQESSKLKFSDNEIAEYLKIQKENNIVEITNNESKNINESTTQEKIISENVNKSEITDTSSLKQNNATSEITNQSKHTNSSSLKQFTTSEKASISQHKSNYNKSPLEKEIDSLQLDPNEKSSLLRSFEKYLEYRVLQGELKLKKDKKEYLINIKKNEENFLNLFKIYILMVRGGYIKRSDFSGIILEENRMQETANGRGRFLREYFIREIQRLDDVL